MAKSAAARLQDNPDSTEFAKLLKESLGENNTFENEVVNGTIIRVEKDAVVVDVGLKSEGRIPLQEFSKPGEDPELKAGDVVEVFIERMEDRDGMTVLSREKARREEVWAELEISHKKEEQVTGTIYNRVKGGFTVDLGGAVAFLPGSQVDIRPIKDISPLMNEPQPFMILKMDRERGNIVVSRRAILEENRAEQRSDLLETLHEGQILEGIVKNITDYGAFVDLGGVDGLLHVTDISWKRVNHPSEALKVGQSVEVQIIKYNEENGRISLGMKQLESDPWEAVQASYTEGMKLKGRITNIADYGAFVELEDGVEGLVHVSEMSWTNKNVHPSNIVALSQEVEVMVLDIDSEKRRISLGLKQTQDNPWDAFAKNHKAGDEISGDVQNITEFGMFIGLAGGIDGMVHLSDVSWEIDGEEALKDYKQGYTVQAKILDIDVDKERIALGIKQLTDDPFEGALEGFNKGDTVTGTVIEIGKSNVMVEVKEGVTGMIKKGDLSRERSEQRPDRFAVGEKVDAMIVGLDKGQRRLTLSIKARELDEDKQAMKEFGSTESGASLGDILGAALQEKQDDSKSAAKTASKKAEDKPKSEEKKEKAKSEEKKDEDNQEEADK